MIIPLLLQLPVASERKYHHRLHYILMLVHCSLSWSSVPLLTTLFMLVISCPCYRNDSSEEGEILIEAGDGRHQQLQDTPKRLQEAQC